MTNVLFVCLHNAGRSQMSEALFERSASGTQHARSAGTQPAQRVHPAVVDAMLELGIDLAERVPQPLTDELAGWADVVVTMGCGDACPYIPGRRYIDWELPDPAGRAARGRARHPRRHRRPREATRRRTREPRARTRRRTTAGLAASRALEHNDREPCTAHPGAVLASTRRALDARRRACRPPAGLPGPG